MLRALYIAFFASLCFACGDPDVIPEEDDQNALDDSMYSDPDVYEDAEDKAEEAEK